MFDFELSLQVYKTNKKKFTLYNDPAYYKIVVWNQTCK